MHQILQPNTDPHEYEPRPADVAGGRRTPKLVFESGDGLDAWMGTVISNAGGSPHVIDLGAKVPVRLAGESEGSEASRYDPHWWHDPRNAEAAVGAIRDCARRRRSRARGDLPRAAPPRTSARLRALDAGIRACLARVPAAQRKLVSDHDAFNYFAHRYGIAVVGAVIPSQTTQAQASAADIADLVRVVRREHVRAIFPESSLSPKLAEQIARETGARGRLHALRRHARPERLARRDVPLDGGGERRRDDARLHRGRARVPIAEPRMTLVSAADLAIGYGGRARARGRDVHGRPRPAARRARPERRRQVDARCAPCSAS